MLTKQELQDFEIKIGQHYEQGKIRSPIHLDSSKDGSLEDFLIKFFEENHIDNNTWIFTTHRSHLPWLLSGRSAEELEKQILEGHSMHIFGHKFFTSAIVSGVAPIALGVALALKMKNSEEKVYCFIGDMSASGGLVKECVRYAEGFDLPIVYVVLNNGCSVRACTEEVWGTANIKDKLVEIKYKRIYNHAGPHVQGVQKYVMF